MCAVSSSTMSIRASGRSGMRLSIGLLGLATLRQGRAQLPQLGWLAQHSVDMGRNVVLGQKPLAPAGEKNDRGGGRQFFHRTGDSASIDMRHAEIGDDRGESLAPVA